MSGTPIPTWVKGPHTNTVHDDAEPGFYIIDNNGKTVAQTIGENAEGNAYRISQLPNLVNACRELARRLEVAELVNRPDVSGNEYDQPAYDEAQAVMRRILRGRP